MTVGQRLPRLEVRSLDGSRVTVGRHPRDAAIVLVPHEACEPCEALGDALEARSRTFGWWAARLVTSRDDELVSTLGLDPGQAAVVIADRFGEVWELHAATRDGHDALPDPDAVEESARYLGSQCPECGVPDRPDSRR